MFCDLFCVTRVEAEVKDGLKLTSPVASWRGGFTPAWSEHQRKEASQVRPLRWIQVENKHFNTVFIQGNVLLAKSPSQHPWRRQFDGNLPCYWKRRLKKLHHTGLFSRWMGNRMFQHLVLTSALSGVPGSCVWPLGWWFNGRLQLCGQLCLVMVLSRKSGSPVLWRRGSTRFPSSRKFTSSGCGGS